jgi:hypothetical protein
VLPIALLFAGTLWLGNAAYIYLSVAFIQMIKVCGHKTVTSNSCKNLEFGQDHLMQQEGNAWYECLRLMGASAQPGAKAGIPSHILVCLPTRTLLCRL